MDEIGRKQHGDDEGQQHCPCYHRLAHLITQLLCGPRRAA